MRKSTKKLLSDARVEKDVENAYRDEIHHCRPDADIDSPHLTDGYARWDKVRLLLEAKFSEDFKSRVPVCNVLGQMLLYLKKFERAGERLPNVLLVGDKDECFVLSTASVQNFLDLDIDWATAPSKGNPELTRALVDGLNVLPYVYDIDGRFDFREVLNKCETLAAGEQRQVQATENNLGAIFAYWVNSVFRDAELTAVEQVDVFLRCLFQPKDVYPHPSRKGVLVVPGYEGTKSGGVVINTDLYLSFFDHFQQGYKPSQVDRFYAMKDRLVEDDARRRQGAFFTPRLWVDEAHKELERVLGPNWRKECIVWDPAAGTANLTRDYNDWGQLICSTAERPDVQVIKEQGWHRGHEVFHYDFLNPGMAGQSPFFEPEDGDNLIPASVEKALREAAKAGKRLVFFMNPPYAEDGVAGAKGETRKGVAASSVVAGECRARNFGRVSRQLYAQFMFQCRQVAVGHGFTEYTVGIFCKPTFMSSGSYRKFRNWWYDSHEYKGGFLFQASHFADVSGRWGISFTVWESGDSATDQEVDLLIRLTDEQDFVVVTNGVKAVYASNGRDASSWVFGAEKGTITYPFPIFSSGLKPRSKEQAHQGRWCAGTLYQMANMGNNLMDSGGWVCMVSGKISRRIGVAVLPANWRRAVALYGARKLVKGDWINDKDEYLVPNEYMYGYDLWVDDCHVYALLHTSNNCTAMRDVQYKGKTWRIKNHWFWLDRKTALKALDTTDTHQTYRDCKAEPTKQATTSALGITETPEPWEQTGDPYFSYALDRLTLSADAQHVLDLLNALWLKSLPMRETYYAGRPVTDKQPDLHLNTWDAGIYQLKHLFRDLFPTEWAELKEAHKTLAARLQPGVYEYGFLKK